MLRSRHDSSRHIWQRLVPNRLATREQKVAKPASEMRIACLQFAPSVGEVDENMTRAERLLHQRAPTSLDLLVLPELAFSGYNFGSRQHISPYLEYARHGTTSRWAKATALQHACNVIVGYPEKAESVDNVLADPDAYNAAIVVDRHGHVVGNYRKSHLYYTDESWALQGQDGFYSEQLPGLGPIALGICMDLNPYKFEAPWDKFEFATFALESGAHVVVVSMAWLTPLDAEDFHKMPKEPDMDSLMYWIGRLAPLIRSKSDQEVIVVLANRTGTEDSAVYTGSSAVFGIRSGEVRIYGILGRCTTDLLIVDTKDPPLMELACRPEDANDPVSGLS